MIDWSQVKSLRNDVGHDEFDEIVELFLEEVEKIVAKLREAPNISELENDMHSLKGSALNLGFATFSQMAYTVKKCQPKEMLQKLILAKSLSVSIHQNQHF
jgi:HPt (histidine-containing phosphotransfer) domain-containing protein